MLTTVARHRSLPFAGVAATVMAVSALAYTGHVPTAFSRDGRDKVIHALLCFALSTLLARALSHRYVLAAVLVTVPLGIDEYLQRFSATRTSDWGDFAADLLGAALAIAVGAYLARRRSMGQNVR